jgi:hypothetical protein
MDMGITDMRTGILSITVTNYDVDDREISIFIDDKFLRDEVIPGGYQWSGTIDLRWLPDDPVKQVSVFSAAGAQTKQVQMIEGSIASVSFELF